MLNKKIIGKKIRQLREEEDSKINQEDLAKMLGLSKQMLSNIETGYRDATLDVTYKAVQHFNVSLDYLLGRTDKPEINK